VRCSCLQVICWELLTREKFYGNMASVSEVTGTLQRSSQLPSKATLARVGHKLGDGTFRESILSMLSLNASERPSVSTLLATWGSCFPQPRQ
jgi:hypothetical protein